MVEMCVRNKYYREAFGLRKLYDSELPNYRESDQCVMLNQLIYGAACAEEYELAVVYVKKILDNNIVPDPSNLKTLRLKLSQDGQDHIWKYITKLCQERDNHAHQGGAWGRGLKSRKEKRVYNSQWYPAQSKRPNRIRSKEQKIKDRIKMRFHLRGTGLADEKIIRQVTKPRKRTSTVPNPDTSWDY